MKLPLFILLLWGSLLSQTMVTVQGGSFDIGGGKNSDENPKTTVTVSSFKMDVTPVTNGEYKKYAKAHYDDGKCYVWSNSGLKKIKKVPNSFRGDTKPVVCVSWYEANKYCKSKGKRLPTEAEWEYVATNKGKTKYSWGNNAPSIDNSWFKKKTTRDVTKDQPSSLGIKDLNGNVWEWVYDRYERDYYNYIEKNNPKGPSVGRFRTIRGGGWYSSASQLRSRNRHWFAPEAPEVSIGFRCVK